MVRKGIYTFHIYNQEVRGAVACQVLNVIFNKTQSQLSLQPMSTTGYQCSYMAITKNKIEKKNMHSSKMHLILFAVLFHPSNLMIFLLQLLKKILLLFLFLAFQILYPIFEHHRNFFSR